jgi:hypothetical protein
VAQTAGRAPRTPIEVIAILNGHNARASGERRWFCQDAGVAAWFNEFDQRTYVAFDLVKPDDIHSAKIRELDDAAIRRVKHEMHKRK